MAAPLSLSFRVDPVGGDLDLGQAWHDLQALKGISHLIFLIHGYNNTKLDADNAYEAFSRKQQDLAGEGRDWAGDATVVRMFWPGDAKWWLAAPAYYPWAVTRAQQVALVLSAMIEELARYLTMSLQLDFVAHSLGNRVLLRTLASLVGNPKAVVRRVVHMAAAVPTWKLEEAEADHLADGLLKETSAGAHAKSFFSLSDLVLWLTFPLGETISPEHDGILPTALGHKAWPEGFRNLNFEQQEAQGAGHSDYWGASKKTPDTLRDWIGRAVQKELNLSAGAPRYSQARTLTTAVEPEAREIDVRATSSRMTGRPPDL